MPRSGMDARQWIEEVKKKRTEVWRSTATALSIRVSPMAQPGSCIQAVPELVLALGE
jgi:hypothetical protein